MTDNIASAYQKPFTDGSNSTFYSKDFCFFQRASGYFYFLLVLICFWSAAAVSQEMAAWRAESSLSERLVERVPVSGRAIAGLLLVPKDGLGQASGFPNVSVRAPVLAIRHACFRALTQDGRYEAHGNFFLRGDGQEQDWAPLEWRSAHAEFLANRRLREIAVLASMERCSEIPRTLFPVQIGTARDMLIALLNTRGAQPVAVLRHESDGRQHRARCRLTDTTPRLAYDFECLFERIQTGRYELFIRVQSIDGASWDTLERLRVYVPS